jgi:hypothetical protein
LQEAVADEIEEESWNFKTTHQQHCKGSTKIKTTTISFEIFHGQQKKEAIQV